LISIFFTYAKLFSEGSQELFKYGFYHLLFTFAERN